MDDDTRRLTIGGQDDFGPIQIPDLGNESTFVMAPMESPTREQTMTEGLEMGDMPQAEDFGDSDIGEPFGSPGGEEDDANEVMNDTIISQRIPNPPTQRGYSRRKNGKRISRHGIEYPSLPQGVVKRLATTLAKTAGVSKAKISSDTLDAIMQATDWFFEQLGDDLSAYARHAGRKTIFTQDWKPITRKATTSALPTDGRPDLQSGSNSTSWASSHSSRAATSFALRQN